MKKGIGVILVLSLLLNCFNAATATALRQGDYSEEIDGITYTVSGSVLTVSGNGEMGDVPSEEVNSVMSIVVEEGITSISDEAFRFFEKVTSVVLPNTLQKIGRSAFGGTNITSIAIPLSCITIDSGAFANTKLKSVVLPKGMTTIKERTFSDCSQLSKVTIPNTVKTIDEFAFYECQNLKKVIVPDSVTKIGYAAFGCKFLSDANGKGSVPIKSFNLIGKAGTEAEIYAISNCIKFNGITTYTDKYVTLKKEKGEPTYRINSELEKTVCLAYLGNSKNVKKFTVPSAIKIKGKKYKVTGLSSNAFLNDTELEEITVAGNNLKYISDSAFYGCSKLKTITVKSNKLTMVFDEALLNTNKALVIKVPKGKRNAYKKLFTGKGNKTVRIK